MGVETRQLVADCIAGQPSAVTELFQRYGQRVYAVCYRILRQRQDAEDAQQETFVRALRSLAGWNPRREFEPWLMAIAANHCRTVLARRARHPALLPIDQQLGRQNAVAGAIALREELLLALAALRPQYRQAFWLYHHDQLTYEEISWRLGCPVGTVKSWVHRARMQLMERLIRRGLVER